MAEPQTNLRVRISGDLADIKQGLGLLRAELAKTAAAGTKAGQQIDSGFAGFTGKITGLSKQVLGFGAAFLSIRTGIQVFTQVIDQADKLNDLNIRFRVSAETISGWGYAAQQTGTDVGVLGVGMKVLAKNMAQALDPNSGAAKQFEAWGISVTDTDGKLKSLEQIVPEIADAFKALDDATLEAALSQELFGKSGTQLLEFLNLGGDGLASLRDRARELGIVLDQNTLSQADQFNDTLGDMKAASQGLTTQMAAELVPILTDAVVGFTDLIKDGEFAGETVDSLRAIVDGAGAAIEGATALTDALSTALEELGGDSDIAKLKLSDLFGVMGDVGKLVGSFGDRIAGGVNELTGRLTGDASLKARGVFQQREALRAGRRALYGQPEFDVTAKVTSTSMADFSGVQSRGLTKADYQRQALEERLNKLLATGSGGSQSDAQRKAEALRRELKRLEEQTKASLDKLREQEIAQEQALQQQLDAAETELLRATGHEAEASFRDIDARWKDLLAKLKANGNTEGAAIVERLIDTQKLQARLADFQNQAKTVLGQLQASESSLAAQSQAGTLSSRDAEAQLQGVRNRSMQQLVDLRAAVQAYYEATKDPSVLTYLQELDGNIATVSASQQQMRQQFADVSVDALSGLFTDLMDSSKDAGDALEDFVQGFIKSMAQIAARALATYLVLQLLDAIYPGLGKTTAATMSAAVQHSGGIAGAGGRRRSGLSPLLFGAAPRYHRGGLAGLRPNEVPAILEKGEEVLPQDDPRHRRNRSAGGGASVSMPIEVNVIKHGSGDGEPRVDLIQEQTKTIVNITLAEVTRQAATKGSPVQRAIQSGLSRGNQYG